MFVNPDNLSETCGKEGCGKLCFVFLSFCFCLFQLVFRFANSRFLEFSGIGEKIGGGGSAFGLLQYHFNE